MLTAALASLISGMLLLWWSSTHFAHDVASSFAQLHHCLSLHLANAFSDLHPIPSKQDVHSLAGLLWRSISLDYVYQQASFKSRVGRLIGKNNQPSLFIILNRNFLVNLMKPFIGSVEVYTFPIWQLYLTHYYPASTARAFLGDVISSTISYKQSIRN